MRTIDDGIEKYLILSEVEGRTNPHTASCRNGPSGGRKRSLGARARLCRASHAFQPKQVLIRAEEVDQVIDLGARVSGIELNAQPCLVERHGGEFHRVDVYPLGAQKLRE